jgi:restriction endonuclease Mrr
VSDVFKHNHDGQVVQTIRSADGGVDIILLSSDGTSIDAVVQCKRFAPNRKIGVELIRQIVGVCIDWQTPHAVIVTSSAYTSNASKLANRFKEHGFIIDLIGASELLLLLKSYNEELPPLTKLSVGELEDLVMHNRDAIESSIVVPDTLTEDGTSHGWSFRRRVTRF